jgi:hypothetical protein
MTFEYQVLEGDSPAIPPDMLNDQGASGWELCSVVERKSAEGNLRWIFYFKRQVVVNASN